MVMGENSSLLPWRSAFSGESKYLTSLHVFEAGDRSSDYSAATITDLEKGVDSNKQKIQVVELAANTCRINDPTNKKLQEKITAALKLLSFREKHVLVQFWWPREVGSGRLVATLDQPFGFGVINDEGLWSYRRDSECNSFVVNKLLGHEEEDDCTPAVRVLTRGLPEWTFDLGSSYTRRQFPQQACAIRCNLHGYLGLPVFDTTTGGYLCCVGVVEILMSSKYTSYAFEVQQLHMALKTQNLTSPQGFDFPTALYVPNEHKQNDLYELWGILKFVCDVLNLPLAQTWAVSQHSSFVACEKVIEKSCSSFDTRCVGIDCMFTTTLPYYVKDLRFWDFREACIHRHLNMNSHGVVGRALLTCGSCFCDDVTELDKQEYPLVHNARMNGLTSCFAIFLWSIETGDEYVLEFFLPPGVNDIWDLLINNLLQLLKQKTEAGSRFKLGDTSFIQDVNQITTTSLDNCMDDNIMFPMFLSHSEPLITKMLTANITYIDDMKTFNFPTSSGLSYLVNQVAQSFDLEAGEIFLKYKDEENDLILITNDEDLKLAVDSMAVNHSINLIICQPN